jgi:hypothetical protein
MNRQTIKKHEHCESMNSICSCFLTFLIDDAIYECSLLRRQKCRTHNNFKKHLVYREFWVDKMFFLQIIKMSISALWRKASPKRI